MPEIRKVPYSEYGKLKDKGYKFYRKSGSKEIEVLDPTQESFDKAVKILKGHEATPVNRIGKELSEMSELFNDINKKLKKIKTDVRQEVIPKHFPEHEGLLQAKTLMVQTAMTAIRVAKSETKKYTHVDTDALIGMVRNILPEVANMLEEMLEAATDIEYRTSSRRVYSGESKEVNEGLKDIWNKFKNSMKNIWNKYKGVFSNWRNTLDKINAKLDMAEESYVGYLDGLFQEQKSDSTGEEVSGNLLKNLIDILHDYVNSEFMVSDDEKNQIINNMKIKLDKHNKGVWKKGPRFVATSEFVKDDTNKRDVEIGIEIVTEKF